MVYNPISSQISVEISTMIQHALEENLLPSWINWRERLKNRDMTWYFLFSPPLKMPLANHSCAKDNFACHFIF